MTTTWKPVPGYEGWYEASSEGRVRSLRSIYNGRGRIPPERVKDLVPLRYRKGYFKVQLGSCGGTRKPSRQFLHRVIFRAFHGDIPDGYVINHIDANVQNNRPDNLEIVTHLGNHSHARALGLVKHRCSTGKRTATLTAEDVIEMRRVLAETEPPTHHMRRVLAQRYGVSASLVRFIEIRRIWRHV